MSGVIPTAKPDIFAARFKLMYCPKCGCHAGPDGSRFCRSCGLRLDGVVQLLARNGAPESFSPETAVVQTPAASPRKKGIRKGGKIVFGAFASFPLIIALCLLVEDGTPLLIPAFIFFVGVMRMLYARLFEDNFNTPPQTVARPAYVAPPVQASALPGYQPPAAQPRFHTSVPTTGNLAEPPSVTEPTTSLLNRQ